jgi:hypothetical protein
VSDDDDFRSSQRKSHFSTKKKEAKKKGEPPCWKSGKRDEAAFPTFPQGPPPATKRKTTRERTRTKKEGGLSTAIITNPRPATQLLVGATPQF